MKTIDGSRGEGGGQILRTATSLSSVLNVPVKVINIRKNRKNPGLRPQHLSGLLALKKITDAHVEGDSLDSQTVVFKPKTLRPVSMTVNIGTAGSVTLILQSILLPLLFAPEPSKVKIIGGTDVEMAPTVDYVKHVFLRFVKQVGGNVHLHIQKRGFYPAGGGSVLLEVKPLTKPLQPVYLTELHNPDVYGKIVVAGLPKDIVLREKKVITEKLQKEGIDIAVEEEHIPRYQVLSLGNSVTLWDESNYVGGDAVGKKGVPAEVVAKTAVNKLIRPYKYNAPVDEFMGDQIIPYLALAEGTSVYRTSRLTMHTLTNLYVVKELTGMSYKIDGSLDGPATITIEGIGYEPHPS